MKSSTTKTNEAKQLETMTLPNGQEVVVLAQHPSKQLAVIDLLTLQRIVRQLSAVDFDEIKEEFISKLKDTGGILEYVQVIADEYNFQTSVNLIRTLPLPKEQSLEMSVD